MTMYSYDWRDAIRLVIEVSSAIRETIDWFDKKRREAYEEAEEYAEEYAEEIAESEPPVAMP